MFSKVKRQPSEWEKIIANETTDKQLISKISIRSSLYDYTTGDSVLRSMIEEYAFQALSDDLVIKRPYYTYSVSETDDVNDFLSTKTLE